MLNFKKIFSYLSSLFLWIIIFLNMFSKKTYSPENIYHLVGVTLISNPSLTILLFILIISGIFTWGKIFEDVINWIKKHNPITYTLSKYEEYYKCGEYDNALLALESKSIWKHFPLYKYLINKLAANTYLIYGKEKLCFQSIEKAYVYAQSEERKIELNKIKIQLFIIAGSVNSAKEILKDMKNNPDISSYQTFSHFEALILEKHGLLEESISKLKSASDLFNKNESQELFVIYNNLGRISGILKNHTDQVIFYEKAKDILSSKSSKYQRHIIYQNLIDSYLYSRNLEKSDLLLNEYYDIIDLQNKHDLLEYYNYLLRFYRQTENSNAFINTINLMHKYLDPLLTKEEQLSTNIHELSFCFNNIGLNLGLLQKIKTDFSLYSKFNLKEKLLAFQIIFKNITSPDGSRHLHPFEEMHKYIFNFLRNSFSEIELYIKNELENFQIYEKCWLLEQKVWLFNFQPHNSVNLYSLIQQKLKLIDEISSIYSYSGNVILSLESKLNLVDECMGSLQNHLTPEQSQSIKDQMLSSFEKVESEIQPYLNHPEMPPSFLRLSRYSLFLNKQDLAKLYLDRFLELGISINHFSNYIQNYYFSVYNNFYS